MSRHLRHDLGTSRPNRFHLQPIPFTTMKRPDDYAKRERSRNNAYRAAYASPQARAWADALTPAQREQAEALGLLAPYLDPAPGDNSLETLPCALEPRAEDKWTANEIPLPLRQRLTATKVHPVWRQLFGEDETRYGEMLYAYLQSSGNPALRWGCLRYLMGQGTCESHARELGMSKQAFHYHVRTLETQLGLPPQNNQRSEAARQNYRISNRRKG